MKSFYYLVLLYFALFFTSTILPQISEITRLPVQNPEQSIKESAPIWISENEIIIFYVSAKKDSILLTRTANAGFSWSNPEFVDTIGPNNVQDPIYLTTLLTITGRILAGWSIEGEGMFIIYSDDNGISWSQPQLILGVGLPEKYSQNLNLVQFRDSSVVLCFNDKDRRATYYRYSVDFGETWSEEYITVTKRMFGNLHYFEDLTVIQLEDNKLIAFYTSDYSGSWGIYQKTSTDGGISWGDSIKIADTEFQEYHPRVVKNNSGEIWLTYQKIDTIYYKSKDYEIRERVKVVNDIYFRKSTDNGDSWLTTERFTKYIGDDAAVNLSLYNDLPFICFTTERFGSTYQIAYAILGNSIEQYTPPFIFYIYVTNLSDSKEEVEVFTTVLDDDEVESVKILMTDSTTTELFDDGEHNDEEAVDNIYGNSIELEKFDINTTSAILDVNKIWLPFNRQGVLADVAHKIIFGEGIIAEDYDDNASVYQRSLYAAHYGTGRYDEGGFLFSGGFYISGYSNGTLWANAQATAPLTVNYLPGRVGDDPGDPGNIVYLVGASDPAFGYNWQRWRNAVELGADFYDGDKDGMYNPVDKNWNGIWDTNEDMPDLLGDQTAWCVYNDGVTDRLRFAGVDPQGIEIQQTLFATSQQELSEVIFLRYEIINRGTESNLLDSVYFSIWTDPDLGVYVNDFVASDSLLNSTFCYDKDSDYVYGINSPAFFTTLLQGPISASTILGDVGYNNMGPLLGVEEFPDSKNLGTPSLAGSERFFPVADPNDEFTARYMMLGYDARGDELDPCTFNLGEVIGGIDCSAINPKYWYSGDPVEGVGWINSVGTDKRMFVNTGPFTLEKDKPVTIIGAYVLGRGTDALNSITVARENVRRAILEYESNFASLIYDPGEPINPVADYKLYHNYPNPFNPTTTIRYELPQDGIVTIKLYDILGQEVTTILNEFKKADRYEVKFDAGGLASGVYIYRMKVNDFITSKKMVLVR